MKVIENSDLDQIERVVEVALKIKIGCAGGSDNHEKADKVIGQCLDKLLEVNKDE